MAIPVNPNSKVEIILPSEKGLPKEEQTIFLVRPVLVSEALDMAQDLGDGKSAIEITDIKKYMAFVAAHLVGWRNFKLNGRDVPCFEGPESSKNLDYFTGKQLMELVQGIISTSGLTDDQLGN